MSEEEDSEETREIEYERYFTREEVADHLEVVVDRLRSGESLTLTVGEESMEVTPGEYIELEVEYEESEDDRELEFELEWTERADDLEIS